MRTALCIVFGVCVLCFCHPATGQDSILLRQPYEHVAPVYPAPLISTPYLRPVAPVYPIPIYQRPVVPYGHRQPWLYRKHYPTPIRDFLFGRYLVF